MKFRIIKNRKLLSEEKFVGYNNENRAEALEFEIPEELQEYTKTINFETDDGNLVDILDSNIYMIKNNLTKYERVRFYLEFSKQINEQEIEVIKTSVAKLEFKPSFDVNKEITDEEINILDSLIIKLDAATNRANAISEDLEKKVADGYFRGEPGDEYVITSEDYEEIGNNVKEDIQPILENIENIANQAENIAKGKSSSVVKDTWAEMEEWLKNDANKGTHNIGDNLYIKAKYTDDTMTERQPDYWIAEVLETPNDKGYYYEISELEADKPDLTEYTKQEQFVTLTQAEYDDLTEKSANTYNFIIEEE